MKATKFFSMLAIAGAVVACNKEEVNGGGNDGGKEKSHERTILTIAFEHQIGAATINAIDAENGEIEFELAVDLINDLSQVEITDMTISYAAQASVKKGDKVDLKAADPTITVTSEAGDVRTYALKMKTFSESFAGCYSITGSKFVGGVGEWDWGTMYLISPEEKNWLWSSEGYGPTANYDNYLEITCTKINDDGSTEGTCIHYGGADEKHWNCIYAGEFNKVTEGLPVDLRPFFRVIPIGESTWKRDYENETITFKSAEGVETVANLKTESFEVSDSKTGKTVEVADQALAFTLAGNTDWPSESLIYTDYQKFVVSPRAFILLVNRVNEVPAESKKIGSEGEINLDPIAPDPDPDPEPDPDPDPEPEAGLNGTYKLVSIKTLGGLGSTGFVENKDKSWMWNSTVNNEFDNLLVVNVSETTGTGTVDYQAGEDGKYWDYVLIADKNKLGTGDMDLSHNFGQLPHGVSDITVNAEGVITFKQGDKTVNGQFLNPGTYPFSKEWASASASITIADGSIAVAFNCTVKPDSEYTWDDAWAYSDFERFALRPFYCVMTFKKQ